LAPYATEERTVADDQLEEAAQMPNDDYLTNDRVNGETKSDPAADAEEDVGEADAPSTYGSP
jgi:hypothetical protein